MNILIIKTSALGDVLRTSVILEGLKEKYEGCMIYWLTSAMSRPLIENNPYINEIFYIEYLDDMIFGESFDMIISLEEELNVLDILKKLNSKKIFGVYLQDNHITYTDDSSLWYDMSLVSKQGKGVADKLKKNNILSYPEILYKMLDMHWNNQRYSIFIKEQNKRYADILKKNINAKNKTTGFVVSAGNRWPMKTMPLDMQISLIKDIYEKNSQTINIILLSGPSEIEKSYVKAIKKECPYILTHDVKQLSEFIGVVDLCDIVITPDSLIMHISIALSKSTIAYFTVTSATEIEIYDGVKIVAKHPDYCTYIKELKPRPNITDSMSIKDIANATEKLINKDI